VRIGFTLPQMGDIARQPGEVSRFAKEAEALGADSLWVGDRVLAPVNPTVGYAGGTDIPTAFHTVLDPLALMAIAAATTERVKIGANILQAPFYPPALLARSLTTIDLVSNGRLLPGFGSGWSPEEFQAAGVPMNERGARLEECLDALEAWWTTNPVEYHGKHWDIPATHVDLKPAQTPRPPIYLAGFTPAAMRRVARRADGWLPVVWAGAGPFTSDPINIPMAEVRRLAAEEGRDPAQLDMILRVYPVAEAGHDDIVEAITRAEAETDVTHCFVELMNVAHDVDHALDIMDRLLKATR
jgi:probable F420-dependent oxidoreductase